MYNVQIFPAKPSSCWEKNHAKSNGAKITSLLLKKGCFQQNCVTGVSYIRLKKKNKRVTLVVVRKRNKAARGKKCANITSLLKHAVNAEGYVLTG